MGCAQGRSVELMYMPRIPCRLTPKDEEKEANDVEKSLDRRT